ncbi:hypothetical protein LCGC14_2322400 [marine sediment metagenome]|uniref:Uncharacterized protein n=1 Tax=marine sediment metagenome TaxID=412755 RepID=A0A0F9CI29_9ZZZZ
MRPSWIYSLKDEEFELRGCWARLWNNRHLGEFDQKMQVLFLRQLCKITTWLMIIGIGVFFSTCKLLTS